jgi:hypothetical protein
VMHSPHRKPARLPAADRPHHAPSPAQEAEVVVDFVQKGATHSDRVVTLHSLLGADFYRGARGIRRARTPAKVPGVGSQWPVVGRLGCHA